MLVFLAQVASLTLPSSFCYIFTILFKKKARMWIRTGISYSAIKQNKPLNQLTVMIFPSHSLIYISYNSDTPIKYSNIRHWPNLFPSVKDPMKLLSLNFYHCTNFGISFVVVVVVSFAFFSICIWRYFLLIQQSFSLLVRNCYKQRRVSLS